MAVAAACLIKPVWLCSACVGLGLLLVGGDDHPNVGTHAGELADNVLVAPLNVVDGVNLSDPVGGETGNDQRRAGPQVAGPDRRTGELAYTFDNGHLAVHLDLRTQAAELVHIAVAVVPNALGENAGTLGQTQNSGDLGLHIGGKPG